jgi:ATP-dependent helicase STH1/SNF2
MEGTLSQSIVLPRTKFSVLVVLSSTSYTEKEEQKRIERLAKERLKALKADDEEAYMKLIDTAKDTCITHLL